MISDTRGIKLYTKHRKVQKIDRGQPTMNTCGIGMTPAICLSLAEGCKNNVKGLTSWFACLSAVYLIKMSFLSLKTPYYVQKITLRRSE